MCNQLYEVVQHSSFLNQISSNLSIKVQIQRMHNSLFIHKFLKNKINVKGLMCWNWVSKM